MTALPFRHAGAARPSVLPRPRAGRRGRGGPARSARRRALRAHRRRRRRHDARGRLQAERLEQRRLLAFDFVAAYAESPLPFFVAGDTTATPRLSEAPQQVTLRFTPGVRLDPASLGAGIQIVRSVDGMFGNGNDLSAMPSAPVGNVLLGDLPNENEVVIRFAETLPDDLYRFTITSGLRAIGGDTATAFEFDVRLDLGSFVTAVVPQPVERAPGGLVQQRDEVHVHFTAGDPLNQASAQTLGNYRLVPVSSTGVDGVPIIPVSVAYTAASARSVLTFAPGAIADGAVYRLEIGPTLVTAAPVSFQFSSAAADDNSSFSSATSLGALRPNGITVAARIDARPTIETPVGSVAIPNQPGTIDEPGHRDVPADSGNHGLPNVATAPPRPSWVLNRPSEGFVGYYNFRPDYGRDPSGSLLTNTITEAQKQRTREVFESFSRLTGIRFVEEVRAPYIGLTVATGDIRAVDPNATPGPGGIIGIAGAARVGTVARFPRWSWTPARTGARASMRAPGSRRPCMRLATPWGCRTPTTYRRSWGLASPARRSFPATTTRFISGNSSQRPALTSTFTRSPSTNGANSPPRPSLAGPAAP